MILAAEKPPQALRGDLELDALGIDTGPRLVQRRLLAEVRREHLDRGAAWLGVVELDHRHGQRIRFLAGRASRDPDAERFVRRLPFYQFREDAGLERLEHLGVTKERGDVDEQVVIQRVYFGLVVAQPVEVVGGGPDAVQRHAAHDAPSDGRVAVRGEIHAGSRPYRGQHLLVSTWRNRLGDHARIDRRLHVRMLADFGELPGDLVWRKDEIHAAAIDGAPRHAGVTGGFRFLREGDAAHGFYLTDALGAVGSSS